MKARFLASSFFTSSAEGLFRFHERPDAFDVLTPDGFGVEVHSRASTLAPSDDLVRFTSSFLFFKFRFTMKHTEYDPPRLFVDEQLQGLFSSWRHEHRVREAGWSEQPAAALDDVIELAHPLLFLFLVFVKARLRKLFAYRHDATARLLRDGEEKAAAAQTRVAVTGATGLIGRRLVRVLAESGVRPVALVRDPDKARKLLGADVECVRWDFAKPEEGEWRERLEGTEAMVHLAGTPLFSRRWTPAFKKEMEESRTHSTRLLVDAFEELERPPRTLVTASAVGYYGMDHEREVDEGSPAGDDLLARICVGWEEEARKAEEQGLRTVQLRIGVVLSTEAGALKEMLPLFRLGLGGVLGSPEPWLNWIHLEDVVRMLTMAVANGEMSGAYDAVAPNPVTNRDFARGLARSLERPCLMRYPRWLIRMGIGEAADYASGGPKASAARVREAGYRFFFEELDEALEQILRSR